MLGIYIWLILIFIIACCACPGFLTILFAIFGFIAAGILVFWIIAIIADKKHEGYDHKTIINREKAIDDWEKKWKHPHPTRMKKIIFALIKQ